MRVNIAVTTLGPVQDDKELLLLTCYLRYVDTVTVTVTVSHLHSPSQTILVR